jgi:hypothetical protein
VRLTCSPGGTTTGALQVALYSARRSRPGFATIGADLLRAGHWPGRGPALVARDFATLTLAVLAGDTFVRRVEADDGWTRDIHLQVELADPCPWLPVVNEIERLLRFLTGDSWQVALRGGSTPNFITNPREAVPSADAVALFSGGLDSSAALALRQASGGRPPALVSYAYPRDGSVQASVRSGLGFSGHQLSVNLDPVHVGQNETSMRARSLGFFALGCLVASTLQGWQPTAQIPLLVPENGLIAINPPLTPRRIGALSTRTTHPFFLQSLQRVLDSVGMGVQIQNPFAALTKGEVLTQARNVGMSAALAGSTVSCGKWKRSRQQCGRCLPCIIRRASFHAAGMVDTTQYRDPVLAAVLPNEARRDDLYSMVSACRRASAMPPLAFASWVAQAGPLPTMRAERQASLGVVQRGLAEVAAYLRHEGCL